MSRLVIFFQDYRDFALVRNGRGIEIPPYVHHEHAGVPNAGAFPNGKKIYHK